MVYFLLIIRRFFHQNILCDLNEWILISVEKHLVDLVIFEAINEDMIAIAETKIEGGLNLLDYTQKYREEYKY